MREIKFRAWNKALNKMYSHKDLLSLTKNITKNRFATGVYLPLNSDIELMECTGIKDKNGKEIYEGDIVEFYSNVEDEIITEKVEYHFGIYRAGDYFVGKIYNKCEVIGNIYENKDLLVE